MDLQQTAQFLVNGIAVGSIIALAGVGLTLTYGILRLANFAHGDFMTLGAYLTWLLNTGINIKDKGNVVFSISGLNIWLSMMVGAIATIGAMLLSEKLLWRPMRERRATSTTLIIISIGLALFIRNGIIFIWGGSPQSYALPILPAIDFFTVKIPANRILVVILAAVAMVGLHLLLQNTKIGKAMRAVADNIELARVTGINVDRVVIWTWAIAGTFTGLGGAMYGLITGLRPNMGWFLILPMFASVILGGIGNPYGAIAGALTIGIAQELIPYLSAALAEYVNLPWLAIGNEYKLAVALLIMVLVLLVRPQGLFKGTL